MAREFAKRFYSSAKWEKCRESFIAHRIEQDGGLCQMCKENTGYIVHHREKLSPENIDNAEITLSFDNLMYVCLDCHNKIHFADWHCLECVFVDGQPMPPPC